MQSHPFIILDFVFFYMPLDDHQSIKKNEEKKGLNNKKERKFSRPICNQTEASKVFCMKFDKIEVCYRIK